MNHCILLRGDPLYGEGVAGAAITPGKAVKVAGAFVSVGSDAPAVTLAAAGVTAFAFARENEVVGNGIDDDYAQNDTVLLIHPRKGDIVLGWLAAGEDIAAGDELSLVGSGNFGAVDAGDGAASPVTFPTPVVAKAVETIDNSAGGAVPVRIKVEVV
jgi:hypothetical protein